MAWSTPLTAVTGNTMTAAQWNASVRDNLLETAPAKFTAAHQIFVGTGANAGAARTLDGDYVGSSQTTTSTAYTDLATAGPVVSATTGVKAIVWMSAKCVHNTVNGNAFMSYVVSGATPTIPASDDFALAHAPGAASGYNQGGIIILQGTLTAGSNTFTSKYRTNTGTATFQYRRLVVLPL